MKQLHYIGRYLMVFGLMLVTAGNSFASNKTNAAFNPQQKQAIEKIVHDYIVNQPEVLVEASRSLQQRQREAMMTKAQDAIAKNAKAIFDANSPSAGNPDGDITIVEFFDYQCIHCKEMKPVIHDLITRDKNIRVIYKDFPIFGSGSRYASMAAIAAMKQGKYLALHNALMKNKQPMNKGTVLSTARRQGINVEQLKHDIKSSEVKKHLRNNAQLAEVLGLGGTPAFIVARFDKNGTPKSYFVPGTVSPAMLQSFIHQLRKS